MAMDRRHGLIAFGLALGIHAGLLLAVFWQEPDAGAEAPGARGLEVGLGAVGGPLGAAEEVEADLVDAESADTATAQPVEATAAPVAPEVTAQTVRDVSDARPVSSASVPTASTAEAPAQAPAASAQAVDTIDADLEPAPDSQVMAERVEAQTVVSPETAATADEPETTTAREVVPEATQAVPAPLEAESEAAVADATAPTQTTQATAAPASAASDEADNADGAPATGSREPGHDRAGDQSAGGGDPGVSPDYLTRLRAWFERHKEYPRQARMRRQEGVVALRFVLARDGTVIDYRIEEGSGHAALDREVARMIERAQPLPAMPDDMTRERLELVLPVEFSLR